MRLVPNIRSLSLLWAAADHGVPIIVLLRNTAGTFMGTLFRCVEAISARSANKQSAGPQQSM